MAVADPRLDEILTKMDDVLSWQKAHLLNYHANLENVEVNRLVEEHRSMYPQVKANSEKLTRIISILEGEEILSDLDGHVVGHLPGMRTDLEHLKRASENGGLHAKMQFTSFQKALITGTLTLLTGVFALLVEIVRGM